VDPRLKKLMKQLGEAINTSLSESEQIAYAISKIKEQGYEVFLVLEATIGFNRRNQEGTSGGPELVTMRNNRDPDLAMSAHDRRFLKSLKIRVDDAA